MNPVIRVVFLLLYVIWMSGLPGAAHAQCDPDKAKVPVSVTVGDGSTPTGPNYTLWSSCPGCQGYSAIIGTFPWGAAMATPYYLGDGAFKIFGNGPYRSPPGLGFYHCERDEAGCKVCEGFLEAQLYSIYGSFNGVVTRVPEGEPAANVVVWATPHNYSTRTDENGFFDFASDSENNYGLQVDGDGLGPLSRTYTLNAGGGAPEDGVVSTTYSNQNVGVQLYLKSPYARNNPPEMRCGDGPDSPDPNAGHPVNVLTGNVWFDHVDVDIPGTGGGIRFVRSFNSINGHQRIGSAFGWGWFHSYERRLEFPSETVVTRRRANGVPYYYQDSDGDGIYQASLPVTDRSWITKAADGYTLHLLSGEVEDYDQEGRLVSTRDAVGNEVILERDAGGKLLRVVNGTSWLDFEYNSVPLITRVVGPEGLTVDYAYDSNGNLRTVTYADGSGYTFNYSWAKVTRVTDATGRILEQHEYDYYSGRGLTSEIADGREKLTFSYSDRATTVTDALGNVTTYDYASIRGLKRLTKVTGSACSSCGGGGSTVQEWAYDDMGRITSHTDGVGAVTTYSYDADGNLIVEADPLGQATTYTYDAQGRVLTRTDPKGAVTRMTHSPAGPLAITDPIGRTTTFTYDAQGRLATLRNARGKTTTFAYDAQGNVTAVTDPLNHTRTYAYDGLGRRTSITDPLGNTSRTEYDALGRVIRIVSPEGNTHQFVYDLGGYRTSVTDALGRTTVFGYDAYGRLQLVTDPLGNVTTYEYDIMSNLIALTNANGVKTSFEYDEFGRLTRTVYPDGSVESFTYDPAGRLVTGTDSNGVVTTHSYDLLGRLIGKAYSDDTSDVSYGYDAVGNLVQADNGYDSLSWTYDEAGQLLSESSAANESVLSFTYDASGNRRGVLLDGSVYLWMTYDGADRLRTIWSKAGPAEPWRNFLFVYDEANRRVATLYPGFLKRAVTLYEYGAASQLTQIRSFNFPSGTLLSQSAYQYDAEGMRIAKETESYTESYTYDALSRLVAVDRDAHLSEQYEYDALGNRVSSLGSSGWLYDARNQLLSDGNATYDYDANGNRTSRVDGSGAWSYEWDGENRLRRVWQNGTETARFTYDPLGRRIEKTADAVTRTFLYDGYDILREVSQGSETRYVHGPQMDEPLASVGLGAGVSYYHADGLRSITTLTNASYDPVWHYRYDSFGRLEIGGERAGYAFTGREWDPETGLYYYRARYYDPDAGRFISADPIGFEAGVNFYTYVWNNPLNWVDPEGLDAYVCHRPLKGLPAGTPYPLVHEWICVVRDGVPTCGGQDRSGSMWGSPGRPSDDSFDENRCERIRSDSCYEQCLEEKIKSPNRPYYRIYWSNCQKWVQESMADCFDRCLARNIRWK